jgi:hypothetical protein
LNLLAENNSGSAPTADELAGWADQHGLTIPVLSDSGWALSNRFEQDYGIPTFSLLGPGMEVLAADDWGSEAMIPEALPEEWSPE